MDMHDDLKNPIESLGKFNPNVLKQLQKLGLNTIADLLFYYPSRYEDFSEVAKIIDLKPEQQISIKAKIIEIRALHGFGKMKNRAEAVVSDDSASLKVVWFNQSYLANSLHKGDEIFLAGKVVDYKNKLQLQNPIYEKINDPDMESIHTGRILPIYKVTSNLPLRTLRSAIYKAQEFADKIEETLPQEIVEDLKLQPLALAVRELHFPENQACLDLAKRRLAFEEIFTAQLAVQQQKTKSEKKKAYPIEFNKFLVQSFLEKLPFAFTSDQKKAAWEIFQDMQNKKPMNRLLEGDVGSGKTLVAFLATLETANKNLQAVLLCPTEILAEQHYANALKYFENHPQISLILLTSNQAKLNGAAVQKKSVIEEIAHGGAQFIISTHAVLQKNVQFKDLALVIIDEQHRFGVRQRAELKKKSSRIQPHLLSMTATPIPRTLRLTLFGDLQISQIQKMPRGRKLIITKYVPEADREKVYQFINKQVSLGRQIFVVTPLIDESDVLGVAAAKAEQQKLQKMFPKLQINLLHGRMKAVEKEKVMQEFLANQAQILVSTSVIEVGVDVPNASVILVEGADRFGLAQLHQLRGRVGRAEHQSYCFLFSNIENEKSIERLKKMELISSGFELAELDLKLRGFGNIFGEEQNGFYYFKYFSYADYPDLLEQAGIWAKKIIQDDPELLNYPALQEKIKDKIVHME